MAENAYGSGATLNGASRNTLNETMGASTSNKKDKNKDKLNADCK